MKQQCSKFSETNCLLNLKGRCSELQNINSPKGFCSMGKACDLQTKKH